MTVTRPAFVAASLAIIATPLAVAAQRKVYRIGVMVESAAIDPWLQAFREGLRERGYIEGVNVTIEQRNLNGALDRAPAVAAVLIQLKVDVLVVGGAVTAQAAKAQTATIPVVFTTVGDPVRAGLVTSMARPGGNMTGLSNVNPELSSKQLELLTLAVPERSRMAVLYNPGNPPSSGMMTRLQETARALRIELHLLEVRQRGELPRVFSA